MSESMSEPMTPVDEIADLADVPVEVEVQLGNKILTIAQILELGPESVIRMPRSAGDNLDILVGGTLIGYGEVVIIEDAVGVRITDFSQEE
jgi:flagellar motor switch protein FliN/FliY